MNNRKMIKIAASAMLVLLILCSGCYTIMSIDQPRTVEAGKQFIAHLVVRTEPDPDFGLDTNPKNQIVSLKIPNDWQVDSVYFSGDLISPSESYCEFLPADQPDAYPSNVDYWTQDLEERYPSPVNMHWETYQSVAPILPLADTTYNDLYIQFTIPTDAETGDFNIAYFVSNAALDFDYEYYYSYSPNNTITVSPPSAIIKSDFKPQEFSLAQNFPNPFNSITTIQYSISGPEHVRLTIFSSDGEEMVNLVDELQNAGSHSVKFDTRNLASGIYLYRLQAGNQSQSRKMMLIK